jgi:aspartyl-tRNA(Asn)/glutamyl-tRNA(Gln) amidotransferase subunit A
MDLYSLSIQSAHEALVAHTFTSVELVQAVLAEIKKIDPKLHAFITVCEKEALAQAAAADARIKKGGDIPILCGIPYTAKDVFSTKGIKTTASSNILKEYIPQYSATVIEKMDTQGAVLVGKTNNDAFGFGSSTENSDFMVTANPWDTSSVAGGSSGGSAASVAMCLGLFSLAEDTGGSIRQPASFCGVTGIKVTYGRVSRYGVLAYGSSLDTIGVMARSVADVATVLEIIAGRDDKDATTLPKPVPDYTVLLKKVDMSKLKIGVPKEYFGKGMDAEVEKSVRAAIETFKTMGAIVVDISLPFTQYAIPAYYLSGISEVSANLARYDGIRFGYSDAHAASIHDVYLDSRGKGFGPEVKRRIMLGTYALSSGYYDAYYKKAQQVRTLIKADFEKAFESVDVLVAPVSPFPAFKIGENTGDPLKMWLADVFTVTLNPAGVPGLAIPCGFTKNNLPIGLQLVGPQLSEELLFSVGYEYQQKTDWHTKVPKREGVI